MTTSPGSPTRGAIIIVGAGAHGAIVADILQRAHEVDAAVWPLGFVDDTPDLLGTSMLGLPILGPLAALGQVTHDAVIVAIGDNRRRRAVTERLIADGERLATAVHPRACVAPSAVIGAGTTISAGAVVSPLAQLGRGVIINTRASIDHHTIVEDFAHVSAGATVGGRVRIGEETLLALGASVISGMTVGPRTIVGAGAVVVTPMPDDVVAFGVPARVRRSRTP